MLLIATAAVLPLRDLRAGRRCSPCGPGTEQSVGAGNQAVAQQVAERIQLYFNNNLRVLSSIAHAAPTARSSNNGSGNASCAITSSISTSSARSPCSMRSGHVRGDQPHRRRR